MQFSVSVVSVLTLIALAIPGLILVKTKVVKENAISALSAILLYVNQPAFTIHSFMQQSFSQDIVFNILAVAGISLIIHLIIIALSYQIFRNDSDKLRGRAYVYSSSFGNIGFMGLPVVKMLMPNNPEVVVYLAVMFVIFNILTWTVGIYTITGDRKYMSLKKAFVNPPTLALIVALPLFIFNVNVSDKIMFPIGYLSDMIVPLSMLILGMRFGASELKKIFSGWGLYVSSFLKLIVTPLIALGFMKLINLDYTVLTTVYILMAMPSASMGLVIAEKFGGDAESSASVILGSSLISMITIPIMLLLI